MPENELEQELEEYAINPNTIRYHSSAKRFFRAFTPKILGTSSIFATSGLAVVSTIAGVATGGLGFIPAVVAGSVAGATAVASGVATVSLGVDAATVSRARYKSEGVEGTRKIVEKMEGEAYEYTQKLAQLESSGQRRIQLKDGRYYSARQLKKLIAGYEKEAYQGVKYLKAKAEENTAQIEKLRNAGNLTESQRSEQTRLWNELESIGACVRNITSRRNEVNPYKNVIINALHKGCLIGRNDAENAEIRNHRIYGNKYLTEELYHNMYEVDLLRRNPQRQENAQANTNTPNPEANTTAPQPENNVRPTQNNQTKRSFGQRIIKKLISLTKEGRRLIAEEEENRKLQENLEYAEAVAYEEHENGINAAAAARAEADKYKKRYEGAVQRGVNERRGRIEQSDLTEDLFNYGVDLENAKEAVEEERDYAQSVAYDEFERASTAESELARAQSKIDGLQNDQERLMRVLVETNGLLDQALKDGKSSDRFANELFELGIQYEKDIERNKKELARELAAREKLAESSAQEISGLKVKNEALEGEVLAQIRARKDAESTVGREKGKREKVESELNEANQTINDLVLGQQENINTIIQAEAENERLKTESSYWQTRAEDAENTVSAVYAASQETIAALDSSVARIQAELDDISAQRSGNLEKANIARQAKTTARKIAEVWNHVKIARDEDMEKYEATTEVVVDALKSSVTEYYIAMEDGDMDAIKRVRETLQEVYDTQRKIDAEHTWPPYVKNKKKIIPGTPVPDSLLDEIFYVK